METARVMWRASVALVILCLGGVGHAEVINGTIIDWGSNYTTGPAIQAIGDGTEHVTVAYSLAVWDPNGEGPYGPEESVRFHGSNPVTVDTDVAWAEGVTDISQITDASIYPFVNTHADHRFRDAEFSPTGVGEFLLLRNINSGYYGVVRVDDIHDWNFLGDPQIYLDVTWWFQTDGTGDFSGVPEPTTLSLLALGAGLLLRRR